jgi:hypothetical protein
MAAAGTLIGGVQSLMQGNYQSAVGKQNASLEYEAARESDAQGRRDAASFYRQASHAEGDEIAAMAANGIEVGTGTALRIQQDTAAAVSEDASNLYHNTYERTRGNLINASNFISQARAAKAQGRSAAISSVFQAGSSLMSAFGQQKLLKAKLGAG